LDHLTITNDTWRVEAETISSGDDVAVVEMRLHSAWLGAVPPFTIRLDAEPGMSLADYEAQALILMAGSAGEMESACIRASIAKSR